jgi:osmotically-inducible protein OsmY
MIIMDEEIKRKIIDQLYCDNRIDSSKISVLVQDGRVTLGGKTQTILARQAASNASWSVHGVVSVTNRIEVQRDPGVAPVREKDVRSMLEMVLAWSPDLDGNDFHVSLKDGVATLEGEVDAYWKKVHAEELASHVKGVVKVENKVNVVPTRSFQDTSIAAEIREALERNTAIEPDTVGVKVENGVVTLSGIVANSAARYAAYVTAVHTEGVVYVDNRIGVENRR